jgi:hypothetical protein
MKSLFSFSYKVLILLTTAYGLVLTFQVEYSILEVFSYFTTLINLFTFFVYFTLVLIILIGKKESNLLKYFKQALLIFLILTSLVYSFVLVPYLMSNPIPYQMWSTKDLLIHYIVPLAVIVDYAFWTPKGQFKKNYILLNSLFLFGYCGYLLIYVSLGGRFTSGGNVGYFPYFFLNFDTLGVPMVVLISIAILFVIILFSWLIYLVDHIAGVKLVPNHKRK